MNSEILTLASIIIVTSLCTFATRFLPFALFGGNRKVPQIVQYLGNILPAAVIAILVVYCLRSINITVISNVLPQLIAVALVTTLHIWKRNNLLSIGAGTIVYMVLVQVVFV